MLSQAVTCLQAKFVSMAIFPNEPALVFLHWFMSFCAPAGKMTLNSVMDVVVTVTVCMHHVASQLTKASSLYVRRHKPSSSLVCGQSLTVSDIVWTSPHADLSSLDRPQKFSGSTTVAMYWVKPMCRGESKGTRCN